MVVLGTVQQAAAQDFRFTQVEIEGNQRIEPETILSFAGIQSGQTLTAGEVNDASQRILASGLFSEVELIPRGSTLVIQVEELPTVNRISIEGNQRLGDDALEPLIQSAPRLVFSPAQAEADAAAITDAYQQSGRLSATVEPRIIRRSENRVDLIFEVTEGRVVENERISFVGNRVYSDRRLRRVLATKQAGFLRTFFTSDSFIEDRIAFDQQLLTDFYQSRGYVDFQVLSVTPELTRERDAVFLTFSVQEGQRFRFGELTAISDLAEIDIDEYQDAIDVDPGDIYSPELIDRTIARMERLALDQGLNFIRVTPRVLRNDEESLLDIELVVERGPRIFVERIDIEGNATTLDRVIRRQFNTVEGDPFNPREIRETAERIRALGYFENADVETREGTAPDQVIVDVDVVEQPTGTLSFGGSFSQSDGFGLVVSLIERNFLGRGQIVELTFNGASDDRQIRLAFTEPFILARDLSFFFDLNLFTSDNNNADFDIERFDFRTGLSFPVSENGRLQTFIGYSDVELLDIDPVNSSPILVAEEGSEAGATLGYTYVFDNRRSGLDPIAGFLVRFGQTIENVGGDASFVRTEGEVSAQRAIFNEEVLLRATFEAGALTTINAGSTRVTDRFFLPSRQLRGFESRGVGPRDLNAVNQDALGGNFYFVTRFETEFPSGLPEEYGVDFGLFWDIGSLWGLDNNIGAGGIPIDDSLSIRSSIGFSIFWTTPLGPLRFNFSSALQKEDFDEVSNFDFTISTRF